MRTRPAVPSGIIPAYAGNTHPSGIKDRFDWDHPRVCGEHRCRTSASTSLTGSSPRMRGTPNPLNGATEAAGIIPAYAGNTNGTGIESVFCRDHPRVCGEHLAPIIAALAGAGSSPRMRGTLERDSLRGDGPGIIPAYAGNTGRCRPSAALHRDHPRVCGEHGEAACPVCGRRGSSPRMRGTLDILGSDGIAAGIIPAYAGNTGSFSNRDYGRRDHPRVCGEHVGSQFLGKIVEGSSPRMRGTPKAAASALISGGIIPAYAGNTQP